MNPNHENEVMPEGEEQAPTGTRAMSVVRWALVAAMLAVAAASIASYVRASAGHGEAGALFHCPMHPAVIQSHPGDCPICGMSLVPVEKAGAPKAAAPAAPPAGHEGHRHEPSDPYACPMHPEETDTDPKGRCPICKMFPVPKEQIPALQKPKVEPGHEGHRHEPSDPYACPMHPEETDTDPKGRCPICKMFPVPKEQIPAPKKAELGVPGLVPVELSVERQQLVGLRTERVAREPLATELRTVGSLAAPEESLARIPTRFSGWIEQVLVNQTGERVEIGQVLATVYSPELYAAQQELLNARRWAAQSPGGTLVADARRKLELLGISDKEIDEIEKSGQPSRAMKIRSPVRGYVTQRTALPGLFVQPGTELFQVADLSKIWLLADVYEAEIGRVKVGQSARLTLTAYPGETFQGRVQFIYPSLNAETRTLRVRLAFRNPDLKLKPGMYGDVALELARAEGLVVPVDAFVDTGDAQYVILARDGGRFEPRRVKAGPRSGEKVQILEGLAEGDRVVTTANFLVDSESRLRAAIEGMTAGSGGHDGHVAATEKR